MPDTSTVFQAEIEAISHACQYALANIKDLVRLINAHIESWNDTNYISIEKEACRACTRITCEQTRKGML